ncbi:MULTISPECIES: hypothetical protein [unclassified Saccharopolyspora]|uniref:hypothetical protein n=1 Tax=unclassified Saccharopolyspora TaxID=2646250 RepID=UPI001CD20563|nr:MULTISPECIES: hypothetical protein [unclassified Saccharopolyspora]MCA1185757.1 hypothetical protein [Saccharopolyspora sp. 6T]MCA1191669.1 hypothetical protein [Saccharopolyspora sp. 6V]
MTEPPADETAFLITAGDYGSLIAFVPDVETVTAVVEKLERRAERSGGPRYSWFPVPVLPSATSLRAIDQLVRDVEQRVEHLFEEEK